jgi:hypothetical protein
VNRYIAEKDTEDNKQTITLDYLLDGAKEKASITFFLKHIRSLYIANVF